MSARADFVPVASEVGPQGRQSAAPPGPAVAISSQSTFISAAKCFIWKDFSYFLDFGRKSLI